MLTKRFNLLHPIVAWLPVSLRGLMTSAALIAAFRYIALAEHDRIFLAASVGGLFLITSLALFTTIAAIWLRFCRLPCRDHLDIASSISATTGLQIPYLGWLPFLQIQTIWKDHPHVASNFVGKNGLLVESITSFERMQTSHVTRQFVVEDVFGMSRVTFQRTVPQSVRIEPLPAAVHDVEAALRIDHGDGMSHPAGKPTGDLIEMRNYQPGDPLKLVLWKHFVRTGQVLVRLPETAVATSSRLVACFVAGDGDEASAGVACSVIASAIKSDEKVTFLADGAAAAAASAQDAIEQIIASVHARKTGGQSIEQLRLQSEAEEANHCLLFVPSHPGPWLERVISAVRHDQWTANAIIGVDELAKPSNRTLLQRSLFRTHHRNKTSIDQVRNVIERLTAAGIRSTIYRRSTGQQLSLAALEVQTN